MRESVPHLLKRLWKHISSTRRQQLILLLGLMILGSFVEVVSIGAVLPFLGVLIAPEQIFNLSVFQSSLKMLGIKNSDDVLIIITAIFCGAIFGTTIIRLVLLRVSTKISFLIGADISAEIYRRTLHQSYSVHCSRNSSEIINGISNKANGVIYHAIVPTLTLINSAIVLAVILVVLILMQPLVALVIFGGSGLIYLGIIRFTRKRLLADSLCIARETTQLIKSLQEGLGGIRDVLIDGSQKTYCDIYKKADQALRKAQGNCLFIGSSPRFLIEGLGMLLIVGVAYFLVAYQRNSFLAIPLLGALALGAQRILPVLQQAYSSWTQIRGGQISLRDAIELLDQPLPDYVDLNYVAPISFKNEIGLHNINFRYDNAMPFVLNNINLVIKKGSKVGFIGETGSGKSTLIDIIMGLLSPSNGFLTIDGVTINSLNTRGWQAHIAHVPQSIFLADCSVAENIAFGVNPDDIDINLVMQAAKQSNISSVIEAWPEKYNTNVGERGVRLSGGQRQRIGIARALYKKADVIIFDEATSALDNQTEEAVMKSIDGLGNELTVLIIAHRTSTLKECDVVVELANGVVSRVGSYNDLLGPF